MNETIIENTMFMQVPAVSALNKVPGFDPTKFLRKKDIGGAEERVDMDLKYKKLWFRLAHPSGRFNVTPLKITDQIAIFEAKIFFEKDDAEPVSSYISQQIAQEKQRGLYIKVAQDDAIDHALSDAGFGIQFSMADPATPQQTGKTQPEPLPQVEKKVEKLDEPPFPSVVKNIDNAKSDEGAGPAEPMTANDEKITIPPLTATRVADEAYEMKIAETANAETLAVEENDDVKAPDETYTVEMAVPDEETTQTSNNTAEPADYTMDTPADIIYELMTVDDAFAIIVDTGVCLGMTLKEVTERRRASLKWYAKSYPGNNNILRAAARIILDKYLPLQDALQKAG